MGLKIHLIIPLMGILLTVAVCQFSIPVFPGGKSTARATTTTTTPGKREPISSTTYRPRNQTQDSCVCGVNQYGGVEMEDKIIGGKKVRIGEYPWLVALYEVSTDNKATYFCEGTLISCDTVLTATHCTQAVKKGNVIYILAGYTDRTNIGLDKMIKARKIIDHKEYGSAKGKTNDNDISLVFLETCLNFTDTIIPACLPWKYEDDTFENMTGIAAGWGATRARYDPRPGRPGEEGRGEMTNYTRSVPIPIISSKKCQQTSAYGFYVVSQISDNQFCGNEDGKGTCQGDSGGGLIFWDVINRRAYAIGIVSWGYGCAEKQFPGVYTLVTRYLNWIVARTEENEGRSDFCGRPREGTNSTTTTAATTRGGLF